VVAIEDLNTRRLYYMDPKDRTAVIEDMEQEIEERQQQKKFKECYELQMEIEFLQRGFTILKEEKAKSGTDQDHMTLTRDDTTLFQTSHIARLSKRPSLRDVFLYADPTSHHAPLGCADDNTQPVTTPRGTPADETPIVESPKTIRQAIKAAQQEARSRDNSPAGGRPQLPKLDITIHQKLKIAQPVKSQSPPTMRPAPLVRDASSGPVPHASNSAAAPGTTAIATRPAGAPFCEEQDKLGYLRQITPGPVESSRDGPPMSPADKTLPHLGRHSRKNTPKTPNLLPTGMERASSASTADMELFQTGPTQTPPESKKKKRNSVSWSCSHSNGGARSSELENAGDNSSRSSPDLQDPARDLHHSRGSTASGSGASDRDQLPIEGTHRSSCTAQEDDDESDSATALSSAGESDNEAPEQEPPALNRMAKVVSSGKWARVAKSYPAYGVRGPPSAKKYALYETIPAGTRSRIVEPAPRPRTWSTGSGKVSLELD